MTDINHRTSHYYDPKERPLFWFAGVFLFLFSVGLTLSPAARARTWEVSLRWDHWIGFLTWLAVAVLVERIVSRRLPERDPYLLPAGLLLTGWGLLTIWRLSPYFGLRQAAWLAVCGVILAIGLRNPTDLSFLRRYKYVWLVSGLLLTALTLFLGTNPGGEGLPQLWLGCCGFYFQPSEPLKLLLVIYLAAYLASVSRAAPLSEAQGLLLPYIAPTLIMTGLALLLLVVQRDLGTASIFLFLYTAVIYLATGKRRFLAAGALGMLSAILVGYFLFDVVRLRVDAWLNPWQDPSGRSYQIVQSLIAVGNGGIFGRGPGIGSPGLVPVAHSDFIYTAIVEETGLTGALVLLGLVGLLTVRGLVSAFNAPDLFRRCLAAGLAAHIGAQSILIMGGNLRLLPLTGVTLPFVSYGGSSLLVSFLTLLLLIQISSSRAISSHASVPPNPHLKTQPYLQLGGLLLLGLGMISLSTGWFTVYRGPDLQTRTDNARRSIDDRYVPRGSLVDRNGKPISISIGTPGEYTRVIIHPPLSPVVGYNNPVYGQAGLEASLDETLRGLRGYPATTVWWDHLLYGQPPPGLDVRVSLDLAQHRLADTWLEGHAGALALLNADTGEILVMASHPGFDANHLEETWQSLVQDPAAPLVNRVLQGTYAAGNLRAHLFPQGLAELGLTNAYVPGLQGVAPSQDDVFITPLQAALAASVISSRGYQPAALLVTALELPKVGWVALPPEHEPLQVLSQREAEQRSRSLALPDKQIWQVVAVTNRLPSSELVPKRNNNFIGYQLSNLEYAVTWYVGGTLPEWQGAPLAVAVVLEEENPLLAEEIGQVVLAGAMGK